MRITVAEWLSIPREERRQMIQWTVAENVIKMQKIKALRRRQANERAR